MLDADGKTREALASLERAASIQDQLAAADPGNARARAETVTNDALRGKLQAKLGQRAPALANLARAVEVSRTLATGNPDNVELRIAVASALEARADSLLVLAQGHRRRRRTPGSRRPPRRDFTEAVEIIAALDKEGAIEGTDAETLAGLRGKRGALGPARRGSATGPEPALVGVAVLPGSSEEPPWRAALKCCPTWSPARAGR